LSRATAGVRDNRTLILNLPGSKKGAEECLNIALPVIKHALALINDKKEEVKSDHVIIQQFDSSKHHHQCSGHHNMDEELKSFSFSSFFYLFLEKFYFTMKVK
jgi:gephyrin